MSYPEKFEGIAIQSHEDWKNPKKIKYDPKPFYDHDVDIKIEACGVCGSDIHCAAGNWGKKKMPLVVGHEIVGTVVKLGSKSNSGLQVGQRVGMGAQVFSCLECDRCKSDNEPYCTKLSPHMVNPTKTGMCPKVVMLITLEFTNILWCPSRKHPISSGCSAAVWWVDRIFPLGPEWLWSR